MGSFFSTPLKNVRSIDNNSRINWLENAKQYYIQSFPENENQELSKDAFDNNLNIYKSEDPKIKSYINKIDEHIFKNSNFKSNQYSSSIIKALKKANKPIHLIDKEEFGRFFVPSVAKDNHLSTRLGAVFTKYKTNQFNWIHEEWEKRNTNIDRSTLEKEYEATNPKPWNLVDEILFRINSYSMDKSIFNFQITNPEQDKLNLRNWSSYQFNPQLMDKKTGEPRNLNELSSGESVLLALAISIYESNDGFDMPKVLLLDEVDATLHLSMIKALLDTIRDVFVNNNIFTILATHKPTTVAISDEESIYFVNKANTLKKIEKQSRDKALSILTEGYATLSDSKIIFENIFRSSADGIIFTEGESDINHIKTAKDIFLQDTSLDYFSCNGATKLKSFLIGIPSDIFVDKKVIGIFDYDRAGIKEIQSNNFCMISDYVYKSKSNDNIFAILLPVPNEEYKNYEYCPIEFLYYKTTLESYGMLKKRSLSEINSTKYVKENEARILNLADFNTKSNLWFHKVNEEIRSKKDFASLISSFDKSEFNNFEPLMNKIREIICS